MRDHEIKSAIKQVHRKVLENLQIAYQAEYDLRTRRECNRRIARGNPTWTLFVNRKGSICHAYYRDGSFMVLESPEDKHGCLREEHALNYFINHVRAITKELR